MNWGSLNSQEMFCDKNRSETGADTYKWDDDKNRNTHTRDVGVSYDISGDLLQLRLNNAF